MKKRTLIPLVLTGVLLLSVNQLKRPSLEKRHPASETFYTHVQDTNERNDRLLRWLEKKSDSLNDWMSKRGTNDGPPDHIDFYIPKSSPRLTGPLGGEIQIAKNTKDLFDSYFPPSDPSSYVGTFFESGNPYIQTARGPYQWDSIKASEMDDPVLFEKAVTALTTKAGIKSMRIGPNLFELDPEAPETWNTFIDKIEIMWRKGVTPTISVAFFPGLKRWEVKSSNGQINYEKSYLLHPQFPKDMGRLTTGMMKMLWARASTVEKDLGRKVNIVINPINEPETLAGFNRQFWHGAHANWGDPETMKFYVPSVIQIAKANVEVRLAAEASNNGRRILFAHNEAMTPAYYPSHHGGGRFAVSKFMLGDSVLMKAEFDALKTMDLSLLKEKALLGNNEVLWAIKEFVFGVWNRNSDAQEKARKDLLSQLEDLKDLHSSLFAKTNKTMKTDNILLVDYYYQTEFLLPYDIERLAQELAENNGRKLKEVLDVKTTSGYLSMLKRAATQNDGDLPPEGPKGSLIDFSYTKIEDVNFKDFLTRNDYLILERLIGLRREYSFKDGAPFEARQQRAGLRPLANQLYRLDHLITRVVQNDGAELQKILGVNSEEAMWSLIKSVRPVDDSKPLAAILNINGQEVFRELLGIRREFLLGFEPQHYARHIRAGIRGGFHQYMVEYVNALRLFVAGVGESGTPFYIFSPLLHDQVMMEYVSALKSGIYGTQYSFGPGVDTRGWAKAPLGLHYDDDHEINPSGLLKVISTKDGKDVKFRGDEETNASWTNQFLDPLFDDL
jgi:hypothetical protein